MSKVKTKILIIEDDATLSNNIKDILEEEGFLVRAEADGSLGIKTAVEWLPDLIICDISLPTRNGYEVIDEIFKMPATRKIPFIFLTARVERQDIRKGMQLGADDYIFKPFDLNDLLNSIKLRLEKSVIRSEPTSSVGEAVYNLNDRITIKTGTKLKICYLKELKYLSSNSPYILLKFADGKNTLRRETLEHWEARLPRDFIRIHRSTIINANYISNIEKVKKTRLVIHLDREEKPFVVSKRYLSKVKNQLS